MAVLYLHFACPTTDPPPHPPVNLPPLLWHYFYIYIVSCESKRVLSLRKSESKINYTPQITPHRESKRKISFFFSEKKAAEKNIQFGGRELLFSPQALNTSWEFLEWSPLMNTVKMSVL